MATLTLQKTVGRNQIHRIHGFPHLGTVPKTCVSNVPETARGHQDLSDLAGSGTTSTFRVSGTCRPGSAACTWLHPDALLLATVPLAPAQGPMCKQYQQATGGKSISQEKRGGSLDLKTHLPGCWHLSSHLPSDASLWFSPLDLPVLSQPHGLCLQRPEERQPAPPALRGLTLPGHTLQEA